MYIICPINKVVKLLQTYPIPSAISKTSRISTTDAVAMGGGGAVRAAAKVAGIGVAKAGIRGGISSVPPPAEHSVRNGSSAAPVSAMITQRGKAVVATAVQRLSWEMKEWDFAGGEEELSLDAGKPIPRLVFGGAPTQQEAKDATSELKDALDKVYLSPPTHKGTDGSFGFGQLSGPSLLSNSDHLENKSGIISEPRAASVPNYAMKAFSLLNESSAAHTVVADIARDPNVWNAVLKNDAVTQFLQTYKTNVEFEDQGSSSTCTEVSDNESQFETRKSENGFGDFFENIKQRVVEMVSNVPKFLRNIFGASSAEYTSAASDARPISVDKTLGASFMGLAVMVIMVVMLKRV